MRELLQPIAADFYNVVDPDGKPIAGLLVLLDGKSRPVRAELHLGGSASDESGRQAIRQSQHILEERYFGPESLPLQVWQSFLRSEQLHVPLPPPDKHPLRGVAPSRVRSEAASASGLFGTGISWQVAAAGLAALVVVVLIWWMVSALRSNTTVATEPSSGGITVPVPEGSAAATSLTEDAAAVTASQDALTGAQLPPSQWANPDIVPGRRVRMIPGFSQPVLDKPGTASGLEIGTFSPDMSVVVVGGPVQLAGDADTIVWLEVDLGSGITGWVAANTSTQALLELAD